ncbi:hypothetical protein KTR66_18995 [Roseococcus sp. SDR]|uniref:hypothetical protein n=1 Tax=Roseococcus sp. SDR TaxID=2835532 RepID=UPI001BCBE5E7|nr:hypothetical protein [Roseococcus sp. SDR]MBS7792095.1 hypothetical protein [Roseococcus sp. SDR]MBV1847409.1 hypothetical protein [Roseococcus sp. SDR]
MMLSTFTHISPHLLGLFMLALACVPLVFVLQDRKRRAVEQKRMALLRREARLAAELHGRGPKKPLVEGWVSQAPR